LTTPVSVVATWHEALNRGDVERLVELSRPDVEVGGPRGTGKGAQLLREWTTRANIRLEPRRAFHKGNTVVVEQEAEWRSAETGESSGSQQIASVFMVRDELVVSVSRYPDLVGALHAAGLDGSHEVAGGYREGTRGSGGEVRTF
jgi:ketosteroid isomerase-like protein